MTDIELLDFSSKRKNIAKKILIENEIFSILGNQNKFKVIGSYDLDLLYDCDIDILVETTSIKEDSYRILKTFIETEFFSKVEYGNFIKFPRNNRPKGYIINLFTIYENEKWEIEIWFMNDINQNVEFNQFVKSKITTNNKIKILREKYYRDLKCQSKEDLSSFQIYKNILEF